MEEYIQTFLIDEIPSNTAKILDNKRLGKQRVETIQILNVLLGINNIGWKNHPAVLMWRGYETFLIKDYLQAMVDEWRFRGYKGEKCEEHLNRLHGLVISSPTIVPHWFSEEFFLSHKSNLLRKDYAYYSPIFGTDIPDDLPYIWPK